MCRARLKKLVRSCRLLEYLDLLCNPSFSVYCCTLPTILVVLLTFMSDGTMCYLYPCSLRDAMYWAHTIGRWYLRYCGAHALVLVFGSQGNPVSLFLRMCTANSLMPGKASMHGFSIFNQNSGIYWRIFATLWRGHIYYVCQTLL